MQSFTETSTAKKTLHVHLIIVKIRTFVYETICTSVLVNSIAECTLCLCICMLVHVHVHVYTITCICCVQGVGEPPTDSTSTRSRHPTGGTLRTTSHVRGTVVGRTAVEEVDSKPRNARRASQNAQGGENPPLPHRLVERLKCDSWEDRKEAICVLEKFVNRYPKALEPHMNKVTHTVHCTCMYM